MTPRALTWSAQTLRWWRHWSNPSWKLGLPGHGSELKSMELEMQFFRRVAQAIWLIDSSYLDLPPLDSLFGKWEIFLPVFFSFQGSRGRTWTCLHEWVQERLVWQARVQRVEIFSHLLGLLSHDFFWGPQGRGACVLLGGNRWKRSEPQKLGEITEVDSFGKKTWTWFILFLGLLAYPFVQQGRTNKTKPGQMVREFATATCQVCGVAKAPPGGIAVTRFGKINRKRTACSQCSHVNG